METNNMSKEINLNTAFNSNFYKADDMSSLLMNTSNAAISIFTFKEPISTALPSFLQAELIGKNAVLQDCNSKLLERLQLSENTTLLGTNIIDFYSQYNFEATKLFLPFIKNNYTLNNIRSTAQLPNGQISAIMINVKANISNGFITSIVVCSYDVTNEVVERSKSKMMGKILNLLGDAVYTCNANLEILNWNTAASRIYGISEEEAIGKTIGDFIIPMYSVGSRNNVIELIKQNGNWQGEVQFTHYQTKKKVTLLSSVTVYEEEEGQIYTIVSKDITERKNLEQAIIEKENKFHNIANNSPVMLWQIDDLSSNTFYSNSLLQFTGLSAEVIRKTGWKNLIFATQQKNIETTVNNAIANKIPYQVEYKLKSSDNTYRWIIDKGVPQYTVNGEFEGYIGVCIDINDLKETQLKLETANTNFELLNKATNEAIWEADLESGIGYWKIGYNKLFGHKFKTVNTDIWLNLVHPNDRERVQKVFIHLDKEKLKENNVLQAEYRFQKADGSYAIVEDTVYVVLDKESNPIRMIGSKKDITKQKETEQKILQIEIDKQIAINKAMIEGQEKEKVELSQELHDNVNQIISSAKLYMEVAKRESEKKDMVEKAIEALGNAITEIRRLSKSLNPCYYAEFNLIDAIQELILSMEETGKLNIEFDYSEFSCTIPLPQLNLYLYRIVQEQLNNIIKYANTNEATILLQNNDHYLFLKIADNGVGFDSSLKRNGIGLNNILNRVNLFNGKMTINSSPNNGCAIEINIPLNISYF